MGRVFKPGIGSSFEFFENRMRMALRGAPSASSVASCNFFEQEETEGGDGEGLQARHRQFF